MKQYKAWELLPEEKVYLKSEADKVIAELKDKCQMHDFFWEGCGFAKRGFKNTIAVSEAFDKLETDNAELKEQVHDYAQGLYVIQARAEKELSHSNYKRCLAMARCCSAELGILVSTWEFKIKHYKKWHKRWLELAEKFKEAK